MYVLYDVMYVNAHVQQQLPTREIITVEVLCQGVVLRRITILLWDWGVCRLWIKSSVVCFVVE